MKEAIQLVAVFALTFGLIYGCNSYKARRFNANYGTEFTAIDFMIGVPQTIPPRR